MIIKGTILALSSFTLTADANSYPTVRARRTTTTQIWHTRHGGEYGLRLDERCAQITRVRSRRHEDQSYVFHCLKRPAIFLKERGILIETAITTLISNFVKHLYPSIELSINL